MESKNRGDLPKSESRLSRRQAIGAGLGAALSASQLFGAADLSVRHVPGVKPRNVIFILTDDHRYDAFGFLHPQEFLRTPTLDTLARDGVHFKNTFVTTSLCSPSRASILTGAYVHRHKIIDNNTPLPRSTVTFPQYLQKGGYTTAFIGKWHMGNAGDDPQPGFDHWVSFRGQGSYVPVPGGLNVDGRKVPQKGYITDELTDYAIDWLKDRRKPDPFFLYLSHKAVHADFQPPDRYKDAYQDATFVPPVNMNGAWTDAPKWARDTRNSVIGVDFPYQLGRDISYYYKRYAETLLGVDDSLSRILRVLSDRGELDSTLIIYTGDNGFAWGEHGLIDKRTAYEESMRVPLLMRCPELFRGGRTVTQMAANIDFLPTILAAGGIEAPASADGMNCLPIAEGKSVPWRRSLLYEYYWERNFPQTPTMHGLRTDRYKYIHYHGIWDLDELYDLQQDPFEMNNLIACADQAGRIKQMNAELFQTLARTDGMSIPLYPDSGAPVNLRKPSGAKAVDFPAPLIQQPQAK